MRECEIDEREWEIVKWNVKVFEQGSKDAEGRQQRQKLYSVSAELKPKQLVKLAQQEIAALFRDAAKAMPRIPVRPRQMRPTDLMATMEVFDLHLGKLCHGAETGFGDYDSKIAEARWKEAFEVLLERVSHLPISRIVLPFGNDFLHADNKRGTTTNGTPLDMDSRYTKMFRKGVEMLGWAIRRCAEVSPVEALAVPGNHDRLSTFTLGIALECLFANTKHVTIDSRETLSKYVQHGKVMLLYTHGDSGKLNELPLRMATEQPQMFSESLWREAHVGHLHMEKAFEDRGVKVRVCPSLSGTDYWHAENAFTGNILSSEAYVWSKTAGPIIKATHTASDAPTRMQ